GKRIEVPAVRKDGSEIEVELAIHRIAVAGPATFTAYLRDITARRQTEEERKNLLAAEQSARCEAEEANRAKDQFLALGSDEQRLVQVFANLLGNAVKYTPQGGTISVQTQKEGDWVMVRVRDTGDGIPAQFLPRLFKPFSQADDTTPSKYGGLGLGLAIVK